LLEGLFQNALDGFSLGLLLPAQIVRAIIRKGEPDAAYRVVRALHCAVLVHHVIRQTYIDRRPAMTTG